MKNTIKILFFLLTISFTSVNAENTLLNESSLLGKKKIKLSCSEIDAEIFIDGKLMGSGEVEVVVLNKSCVTVRIKKVGFLIQKIVFCNKKSASKPPKTYYVELAKDDAYNSSISTDMANIDVEIETSKDEKAAWKLLSQIVTNSFDVIEITDRETGYLRTSWTLKSFKQSTIRTRIIVRQSSTEPLKYKVKLISEVAENAGVSVKKDELYSDWDRILRKYKDIISELLTRLK
ncbi:MAG: hypothetical protein COA67_02260 [Lutibacter sp.]|nr:MAG: hypothetical protein COA67_02260 [Lutibacter sp.]